MSKKGGFGAQIVKAVELQSEKELRRQGRKSAEVIRDEIKQDATISLTEGYATGEFVDSITIKNQYGGRGKLPSWRILSKDPKARFLEWGTSDTTEHGFFAKAALRHGGTMNDSGDE